MALHVGEFFLADAEFDGKGGVGLGGGRRLDGLGRGVAGAEEAFEQPGVGFPVVAVVGGRSGDDPGNAVELELGEGFLDGLGEIFAVGVIGRAVLIGGLFLLVDYGPGYSGGPLATQMEPHPRRSVRKRVTFSGEWDAGRPRQARGGEASGRVARAAPGAGSGLFAAFVLDALFFITRPFYSEPMGP
jgi:hypothetical protein